MKTGCVPKLALAVVLVAGAAMGQEAAGVPADASAAEAADLRQRLAAAESAIRDLQSESRRDQTGGIEVPGLDRVLVGGQGAVAGFDSQAYEGTPDSGFRVDEALIFIEAQLHPRAYLFTELKLLERESPDESTKLGELYIDFEDPLPAGAGVPERLLCLRAGRFDTPFGEEYLSRDASLNPLVSHSLSDVWGVDEGVAVYGQFRRADYIVAVQNEGDSAVSEGNGDKAVAVRVGYAPREGLRVSVSAMRTGDLDVEDDGASELWVGNGVFRSLGAPESTTTFHADLLEADVRGSWRGGHVAAAAGVWRYDDDDTAADNARDTVYGFVEGQQDVSRQCYAAARYSRLHTSEGFPVVGQAGFAYFGPPPWTEDIWRLSLGLGCRVSAKLMLKTEYSLERGADTAGQDRTDADLASVQLAYRF